MNDQRSADLRDMKRIVQYLQQNDNYLILTHRRPDGDTLGSAAALCAGLRTLGKTAYIWRNPEITARYLPYTKPYFAPEGWQHAAAVAVDTASSSMLGREWNGPVHMRIDHHPGPGGYAGLEYTDPSAAACGEVIQELLELLGVTLTKEIAEALYIAIVTDTGCFRYPNTTAVTHRRTAALLDVGIDAYGLNAEMIFSKSRRRMAVEAALSANISYIADGLAAVASLTLTEKDGAGEDDLENIAGLIQSIEGVKIAMLLREEPDSWRVSCRTSAPYAANKICGILGGGGHDRAAGAELKEHLAPQDARSRVIEAIREIYPELRG
jgi:phosphoesterase RecJ-like protein